MFPIMYGLVNRQRGEIPWRLIESHERQALRNHNQTLERLAERGGLDPHEALCVLGDRDLTWSDPATTTYAELLAFVAGMEAEQARLGA